MRKISKALLVAIAALLALGVFTSGASAHATLIKSQPAASESLGQSPLEVVLWFTEALEIGFSKAYVTDSSGERWELPNEGAFHVHTDPAIPVLHMKPGLPNGAYTVVWDVLSSIDGHRTKGFFTFFVGPPPLQPLDPSAPPPVDLGAGSAPPRWLEVLSRSGNFAAMAALIGTVVFPFLVLPAVVQALRPAPDSERAVRRALRSSRVSALISSLSLVVASGLALWVQAWLASGDSTSLQAVEEVWSGTRYGDIWTARILLAGAAVVASVIIVVRGANQWHESIVHPSNTSWALLLLLSVGVPVTTSLNSHAAAGGSTDLQTIVDYFHLLAGGLWVGVLLQLGLAIAIALPALEERAPFLGALVRRFSWIAVPSVTVIIGTGLVQSIDRLGGIDELFDSNYGNTLVVKIALLAPLLLIAAFNLLVFGPRFLRLATGSAQAARSRLPRWEGGFRVAVLLEIGLAISVLAVTALLTSTSPQGSAAGDGVEGPAVARPTPRPDSGLAVADDLRLSVYADPAKPGANQVNVFIQDEDGDVKEVLRVILRYRYLAEDLGVVEEDAQPVHPPDHYIAGTTQLSLPGMWEVEVIVRRQGLLDTRAKIQLEIEA